VSALLAALLATLLAAMLPLAVMAASGLPPAVAIIPDQPGPGGRAEISGLDFPAGASIELMLVTNAGVTPLGTATASTTGTFRQAVTLPSTVVPGWWEIRATGPGDTIAVRLFKPGAPVVVPPAPAGQAADPAPLVAAEPEKPAPAAPPGAFDGTDLVAAAVLIGLLLGIALVFFRTWRALRFRSPGPAPRRRPSRRSGGDDDLPAGDDPIWSGAGGSR
jgi:hypothetical protein